MTCLATMAVWQRPGPLPRMTPPQCQCVGHKKSLKNVFRLTTHPKGFPFPPPPLEMVDSSAVPDRFPEPFLLTWQRQLDPSFPNASLQLISSAMAELFNLGCLHLNLLTSKLFVAKMGWFHQPIFCLLGPTGLELFFRKYRISKPQ